MTEAGVFADEAAVCPVTQVQQKVAQNYKVISRTCREEVQLVRRRKDHVPTEELLLPLALKVPVLVLERLHEAKVYQADVILRVLAEVTVAYDDVIELEVVVREASLVDRL